MTTEPVRAAKSNRNDYFTHIDGLRAVAVVLVLLYHAGFGFVPGGYVGVDVFFVISGFLITGLLLTELENSGRIDFIRFYARRARRILPIASLVLVATAIASWLILSPLRWESTAKDIAAAAGWSANMRFAHLQTDYLTAGDAPSVLLHYWSLGVEEQYYVLWPVLMFVVYELTWRLGLSVRRTYAFLASVVIAVSLPLAVHWVSYRQPDAFFQLPTRAWELAAGGLLACAHPMIARAPRWVRDGFGFAGLPAIGASTVFFDDNTLWPGAATAVPVLGAIGAICAAGASAKLLAFRPMRAVGRWSFSLYLWHWPILMLVPVAVGAELTTTQLGLLLAVTTALAAFTYRFVETPFRFSDPLVRSNVRSLVTGSGLVALSLTAALLLGTAPSGMASASGRQSTMHLPYSALLTAADDVVAMPTVMYPALSEARYDSERDLIGDCYADPMDEKAPAKGCYYGDRSASMTVALIGDSHAAQWFRPLDRILKERHLRLLILIKPACPSVPLALDHDTYGSYPRCDTWNDSVMSRLRAERPAVTIVSAHAATKVPVGIDSMAYRVDAWTNLFHSLSSFTKPILFTDTPTPRENVPHCIADNVSDVRPCTFDRSGAPGAELGLASERAAARMLEVDMVDTAELVCPREICPVVVGDIMIYRDKSHLSGPFANWLQAPLTSLLDPFLPKL